VGLFYYAGHGIQVNNRNYLIPTNADIISESDVEYEALDAGRILGKMKDAGNNMNIVILDACRNNPFSRSFRTSVRGLVKMDAPTGSLIAYATSPGSLAADGDGKNGIYTKYLVQNLQKPNLKIEEVFKNVRLAVVKETANKQVPWESSSLMGTFYFTSPEIKQVTLPQNVASVKKEDNSFELLFWESIRESKDVNMFKAYKKKFPNGQFILLADLKIQQFQKEVQNKPAATAPKKIVDKPLTRPNTIGKVKDPTQELSPKHTTQSTTITYNEYKQKLKNHNMAPEDFRIVTSTKTGKVWMRYNKRIYSYSETEKIYEVLRSC